MISIKKPRKRVDADYSDILFGHGFLHEINVKPESLVGQQVVLIPWTCAFDYLRKFIDIQEWLNEITYACPYVSRNVYHWMYPLAILTDKETQYAVEANSRDFSKKPWRVRKVSLDSQSIDEWDCEVHDCHRTMLGHGYTDFTSPDDGSRSLVLGTVLLDNGDRILVACWLWHNK